LSTTACWKIASSVTKHGDAREDEEQHDDADNDVAACDERDQERGEQGDRRGEPDVRRPLSGGRV